LTELTDEIRAFLNERRFAVLATRNPDGTIQQSVMWYLLEGESIVMNTARGRVKFRNIERSKAVSICVEDGPRSVTIAGEFKLNDDPATGLADIQRIGRRYDSEEEIQQALETWKTQQRVTMTLPINRVVTHGF